MHIYLYIYSHYFFKLKNIVIELPYFHLTVLWPHTGNILEHTDLPISFKC